MVSNKDLYTFNASDFLFFLHKWRKPLIATTAIAFLLSILVSFLIPAKYKSTVILFPASTHSISKALLPNERLPGDRYDLLKFGEEEELEQLLQILHSDEIRDKIIGKYDLLKHYDIDRSIKDKNSRIKDAFENNITIKKTEFMSIKIDVLDIDATLAASIANDIVSLADSAKKHILRDRALKALKIVENEYIKKQKYVDALEDSIVFYMENGIFDYEEQSKVAYREYTKAISRGNSQGAQVLKENLKLISDHGWAYVSLRDDIFYERSQLNMLKTNYEQAQVDAEKFLPSKFIVNTAYPADRTFYPKKWLIVLTSTLSAFLLAVIVISTLENASKMSRLRVDNDLLRKNIPLKESKVKKLVEME